MKKLFYVFSGQGAQAVGMGKSLYDNSPEAKKIFDLADATLGFELSKICFEGPVEKLTGTDICQVAIYTMSCAALAAFQKKFPQCKPVACAGLSLGEYAALHAGGAFSFADGLKILQQRANLMDKACSETDGTMATILGGDLAIIEEVAQVCDIDVANYNSPGQIVVSGERAKVEKAVEELKARGMKKVILLNVAGAFHSRLMASAGEGMKQVLADAAIAMPGVPVFQNFTAEPPASVEELKNNLIHQVAGSVRWESCVRNMIAAGGDYMVEFGPGNVLTGLLRRTDSTVGYYNVNSFESLDGFEL